MTPVANPGPLSLRARWFKPGVRRMLGSIMGRPKPHAQQRRELDRVAAMSGWIRPRGPRIAGAALGGVDGLCVTPRNGAALGQARRHLLYFHGGGYAVGSPEVYRPLSATLVQATGATAFLPRYRLAPEHPHPAAVEDALAVYRALLAAGAAPEGIAFAGDSAGGGLSLACALAAREQGLPQPGAIACYSPWTDLTVSGASVQRNRHSELVLSPAESERFVSSYAAQQDRRLPLISPLFADLRGLAPLLIQVTDTEILLDDSLRLAEAARAAGVSVELQVWQGLWHVWQALPILLPEADAALAATARFLAARLPR